jgi:hypothetical protein
VLLNCVVRPVSAPTICVAEAPIETWLKALLLDIIAAPVLAQLYRCLDARIAAKLVNAMYHIQHRNERLSLASC